MEADCACYVAAAQIHDYPDDVAERRPHFASDFGLFYQVPMDSGALYNVTQTVDTYVYRALIKNGDVGMSAAASLIQSIVGFVTVVTANWLVKKQTATVHCSDRRTNKWEANFIPAANAFSMGIACAAACDLRGNAGPLCADSGKLPDG